MYVKIQRALKKSGYQELRPYQDVIAKRKESQMSFCHYCDNSSKVVILKVHCIYCTGPICHFETNFSLE